jgi:hypothetical protein
MTDNAEASTILKALTSPAFARLIEIILQPYKERVLDVEKQNLQLLNKIKTLENRINITETSITSRNQTAENIAKHAVQDINKTIEQAKLIEKQQKYQNLILQGLPEEENENLQSRVSQIITEKFKSTAQIDCRRLGKKIETTEVSTPASPTEMPITNRRIHRPVLISFTNIWKRREIYRSRVQALKSTDLYLCEDLPPEKIQLAFQARELKRKGKIFATWTQDWKIMVKETVLSPPKEITSTTDITSTSINQETSRNTTNQVTEKPSMNSLPHETSSKETVYATPPSTLKDYQELTPQEIEDSIKKHIEFLQNLKQNDQQ